MNPRNRAWTVAAKFLASKTNDPEAREALEMMRIAKVFELPPEFEEATPKFDPSTCFPLPFPCIAVVNDNGVEVLKQTGDHTFNFVSIFPPDLSLPPSFSRGELKQINGRYATELGGTNTWLPPKYRGLEQQVLSSAITGAEIALCIMAIIQSPRQFIVELEPKHKRKGPRKNPEPVARLSERPIYINLTSQKIRERFGTPTGRHIVDHDRRAHYRVLRSDRFVKKQGQRVFVKAHFAAPVKGVTPEGRRYKIRLDIVSHGSSDSI